jgi:ribose transport system substrate-binding protein
MSAPSSHPLGEKRKEGMKTMKKRITNLLRGLVVATAAVSLAACGAGSDAAPAASGPAEELSPAAQSAQEIVDTISQPVGAFTAPGPALEDISELSGKTVYYVAATLSVPMFTVIADALEEALGEAGVSLQVCDGKANPQSIATCIDQAVQADAGAVISGSVPYELASVAFDSVTKAGIPLLYTQVAPAGPGDPKQVGYLSPDNVEMQAWMANWVIADSNAKADVLAVGLSDTPATKLWMEQGALATYKEKCADCKVTFQEINTGQMDKLPSQISSALVANPGITHIHALADSLVQPIQQGLQSAGISPDDIKVISMEGSLAVMQLLADGRFMNAEVGTNLQALGWYSADQTLRMMSGQPSVQNLNFPYRMLFNQDATKELTLTPEAEASGEWYGDASFREGFTKLWGLD